MIAWLKSNWREALSIGFVFTMVVVILRYMTGVDSQPSDGWWPLVMTLLTRLAAGMMCFTVVLLAGWAALKVTLPEGSKFTDSSKFDAWWESESDQVKAIISIAVAIVLMVIAALCMVATR